MLVFVLARVGVEVATRTTSRIHSINALGKDSAAAVKKKKKSGATGAVQVPMSES